MKKARIALTAIAMFAVVGGALAVKATKFGGATYYTASTSTASATLTLSSGLFTTTTTSPVKYYTLIYGAPATTTARFTTIP
jgi:uncharacterized protein YxeA